MDGFQQTVELENSPAQEPETAPVLETPAETAPVIETPVETVAPEVAAPEAEIPVTETEAPAALEAPKPDLNAEATKHAINAAGSFVLRAIYTKKVNETHAVIANRVAKIMDEQIRTANWTQEEVSGIWSYVENQIKEERDEAFRVTQAMLGTESRHINIMGA